MGFLLTKPIGFVILKQVQDDKPYGLQEENP
jgi:hypothetical protein